MKQPILSRTGSISGGLLCLALIMLVLAGMFALGTGAAAQTQSTRDIATAYGARLNARGEPANLNPNRINNRVNNRLDTRLSLRIERYRPDSPADPTAVLAVRPIDNARIGTATTFAPLSSSKLVSQTPPRAKDSGAHPR